ncbi:MAG: hypothetical protein KDD60_02025, partial [Bdellovibrionales bacterium]|nr:hypothetical protein [Bdellovibrionales bacterium]
VYYHKNPMDRGSAPEKLPIRIQKGDRLAVIPMHETLTIATYGKKRRKQHLVAWKNSNEREVLQLKVPKGTLVSPIQNENELLSAGVLLEKTRKKKRTYQFVDLHSGLANQISHTSNVLPGYFVPTESKIAQYAVTTARGIAIYEAFAPDTLIANINLKSDSSPLPDEVPGDKIDSPNCISEVPTKELDRAKQALREGDIITFQGIMTAIQAGNYCAETIAEINKYLQTRSASMEGFATLLGAAVFVTDSDQRKPGGCDTLRGNSDGPGGFVSKDSDNDSNFVTLAPSNFNTSQAELVYPDLKGTVIKKLRYVGRSNGFRPTFRSDSPSSSLPEHLIVKFYVGGGFFGSKPEAWCFELTNSHNRND